MHPRSHLESGDTAQGSLGSSIGEALGRKRKRSGTPTVILPESGNAAPEKLSKVRMRFLSKLHRKRPLLDSIESVWETVLETFEETRPDDISFATLFSVNLAERQYVKPETSSSNETYLMPGWLTFKGLAGLKGRAPEVLSFSELASTRLCGESQLDGPRLLQIGSMSAIYKVVEGMVHVPKEPVDGLAFCPILAQSGTLTGVALLGVNSQSYDDEFEIFVQLLSDVLGKLFNTALIRKNLQETQEASEVVSRRAEEAERSNFMFRRMAESATVGCAIFDPSGHPMWLNEAYMNLTGCNREDFRPGVWQKSIIPEDVPEVEAQWKKLAAGQSITPFTFRVKRLHDSIAKLGSCESLDHRWLLSNAYVDSNEDGTCRRIMGWLTDISAQKLSEHLQAERLADALETKRQTENFIDMVSHEIRNPLSAIIQTADGLLASMEQQNEDGIPLAIRESIADAGEVIILCAHHQKRIVDDILTLSKLDSNLLVISLVEVRPRDLVKNAMKMFEAEFASASIEASIIIDDSYEALSVECLLLDESRVLQILLNLITNAIKFTRNRMERHIRVRLAASSTRPSIETSGISYIAPRVSQPMDDTSSGSNVHKNLFLIFAVEDTGPGLDKMDMKSLFQRFSQASPKTYRGYGGFGLGLFICRELAELQGGQIGLSSILGKGTTFTFYVRAQQHKPKILDSLHSSGIENVELVVNNNTDDYSGDLNKITNTKSLATTATVNAEIDPQTLHILVVEDNKINQKVLVRQLRLLGCTVYTADHGLEALELLGRSNFHVSQICQNGILTPPIQLSLIMMDIEMPVMDGLTCVRRIRRKEVEGTFKHVPVIAVTANARSDQIAAAMEAGMDFVVTKPFRIPELIVTIEKVIKTDEAGRPKSSDQTLTLKAP